MKMTEFLDQSADWGDPSLINEMFHADYMYLRETEMLTRDEFIKHMQEDFAAGKFQYQTEKSCMRMTTSFLGNIALRRPTIRERSPLRV